MAQFMLSLLLATIQLPLVSTDEFHFNNEAKSWIDALEYCESNSSFLAEITSDSMWEEVKTQLTEEITYTKDGAWIGLERSIFAINDITWRWVLNGNQSSYHWNDSFPMDIYNYHCGKIIYYQEKELKLLDDNCHTKLPFICQKSSQT